MNPGLELRDLEERIVALAPRLDAPEAAGIREAAGRLAAFMGLLLRENARVNLVSGRAADPRELVERHLFDSLLGLRHLPEPRGTAILLLDIGTGGGFPAVPLLLVRRDLRGTLVESTQKKCKYLQGLAAELALTAEVMNARFPDTFPMKSPTRYDVLTTRAVRSAGRLVRRSRPLLGPGARALLWTTEPLFPGALRESGAQRGRFHRAPGAESRGIGVLGSFT